MSWQSRVSAKDGPKYENISLLKSFENTKAFQRTFLSNFKWTRLAMKTGKGRERGFYAGVGLLGFKEGEGELKLRLTILYHNFSVVCQSADTLEIHANLST